MTAADLFKDQLKQKKVNLNFVFYAYTKLTLHPLKTLLIIYENDKVSEIIL